MRKFYCPTCKRDFDPDKSQAMPFCSVRCRDVDLGRWLDESNAVPCDPESAAEAEAVDADDPS